jgi:two-component system sensor histidine kinase TctE
LFSAPSIRRQLIYWLVLPLSAALVFSAVIVHKLASDFVTEAYDRALYDSALDLSRRLRLKDGHVVVDLPPAARDMLEVDDLDRVFYQVRASTGELIIGTANLPHPRALVDRRPVYYYGRHLDYDLRLVALRVPYDPDDEHALALVVVGETMIRREQLAKEILAGVVISHLTLIVMVAVSIYLGVWHGLLPLKRLRQQLENRSHRDLTPLDEPQTPIEIRPMVHATNEFMQRLERAIASQQRFIAHAAHQLRTPLAGLKTHAELALRENTVEAARERVHALMFATDRSARLVNQLLSLARAEPASRAFTAPTSVDLGQLARETTTEWVPRAIERGVDLGLSLGKDRVQMIGDPVLLRELLNNLIDNSIRYTGAGGHVTVRVDAGAEGSTLTVEDDGPGIAPPDRERVFQRFVRLDADDSDGCGLGLAIVREIADLHGGTVTITDGPGEKGTSVRTSFPVQHEV